MFFVAKRIFLRAEVGRASTSAVRIATAGVVVGIMVMLMSICVTIGFQREVKDRMSAVVGHCQVMNAYSLYNDLPRPIQITDSLCLSLRRQDGVRTVSRYVLYPGMLKTEDSFKGIMFRGVGEDFDSSFLSTCLISGTIPAFGSPARGTSSAKDSIVLSVRLASEMKVGVGERIYAYFFDSGLRVRRFVVAGTYQTNLADYDTKICYADSRVVQKLARMDSCQYSGAEVRLADRASLDTLYAALSQPFLHLQDDYGQPYAVARVEEIFPQIFSWLTLLDTNVVAILILMISVACVTMVSGLIIIILERTRFIGVMKAMGATNRQLRHIFLYLASLIVLRGLLLGNILAFVILGIQRFTGIVALDPANYYLDRVPVYFPWMAIILTNLLTMFVCVLVLVLPTYLISRVYPVKSIRFE